MYTIINIDAPVFTSLHEDVARFIMDNSVLEHAQILSQGPDKPFIYQCDDGTDLEILKLMMTATVASVAYQNKMYRLKEKPSDVDSAAFFRPLVGGLFKFKCCVTAGIYDSRSGEVVIHSKTDKYTHRKVEV